MDAMNNILLIYTSMTGNTELMAETIEAALREEKVGLIVKESLDAYPEELLDYDGIIIGSYTWDGGVVPDEFMDFYEEMDRLDLTGKKAAVFGSGDTYYSSTFCKAVDLISEKLASLGAIITVDGMKADLTPEDEVLDKCRQFAKEFARSLTD